MTASEHSDWFALNPGLSLRRPLIGSSRCRIHSTSVFFTLDKHTEEFDASWAQHPFDQAQGTAFTAARFRELCGIITPQPLPDVLVMDLKRSRNRPMLMQSIRENRLLRTVRQKSVLRLTCSLEEDAGKSEDGIHYLCAWQAH